MDRGPVTESPVRVRPTILHMRLSQRVRGLREYFRHRTPAEVIALSMLAVATAAAAGLGPTVITQLTTSTAVLWLLFGVAVASIWAAKVWIDRLDRRRGDLMVMTARIEGGQSLTHWTDEQVHLALGRAQDRYLSAYEVTLTLPAVTDRWSTFPYRFVGAISRVRGASGERGDLRGITPLGSLTMLFATGFVLAAEGRFETIVPYDSAAKALGAPVESQVERPGDGPDRAPIVTLGRDESAQADDHGALALVFDLTTTSYASAALDDLEPMRIPRVVIELSTPRHLDLQGGQITDLCQQLRSLLPPVAATCSELHVTVAAPAPVALALGQVVGGFHRQPNDVRLVLHERRSTDPTSGSYEIWTLAC